MYKTFQNSDNEIKPKKKTNKRHTLINKTIILMYRCVFSRFSSALQVFRNAGFSGCISIHFANKL